MPPHPKGRGPEWENWAAAGLGALGPQWHGAPSATETPGFQPSTPLDPCSAHFHLPHPTPWVRGWTQSDSSRQCGAGAARSGSPHLRAPLTSFCSGSRAAALGSWDVSGEAWRRCAGGRRGRDRPGVSARRRPGLQQLRVWRAGTTAEPEERTAAVPGQNARAPTRPWRGFRDTGAWGP